MPHPVPHHRVIFADEVAQLTVPVVAPPDADRNAPLPVDYLTAIANAEVQALRDGNVTGAAQPTLLYMLMRHATLLVMTHTAVMVDPTLGAARPADPVFVEDPSTTPFAKMTRPVAALGGMTLEQAIAAPSLLPLPDLAGLADHRAASACSPLNPSGCSSGSPSGRSTRHRTASTPGSPRWPRNGWRRCAAEPTGCHLGAYAWVDAPPVPSVVPRDGDPVAVDPDSEGYLHGPRLEHARTAAVLRGAFLARLREGAEAPLAVDLSADRVADAVALLDGVRHGASLGALLGERIERWMIDAGFGERLPDMRTDMPLIGRQRSVAVSTGCTSQRTGSAAGRAISAAFPRGSTRRLTCSATCCSPRRCTSRLPATRCAPSRPSPRWTAG